MITTEVWMIEQQTFSELGCMLGLQNQSRSQTECFRTTSQKIYTWLEEVPLHFLSCVFECCIKSNKCSISSHVVNESIFFSHSVEFYLEEGACVLNQIQKIFLLDLFPNNTKVEQFNHINCLFKIPSIVLLFKVNSAVISTDSCSSSKGQNVRFFLQKPMFITPELSSSTNTCFGFINNERNLEF